LVLDLSLSRILICTSLSASLEDLYGTTCCQPSHRKQYMIGKSIVDNSLIADPYVNSRN
jgi:hypothetical protein